MHIAYASDLHLEFNDLLPMTGLLDVDVLILAGDVETDPKYYATLLRSLRIIYRGPVIFVMGNHEYYHRTFPDALQDYQKAIAADGHAWILEKEALVLGEVRFLGTTLWSSLAEGKQAENCQSGMSDFAVIAQPDGELLQAETVMAAHRQSMNWLEASFYEPHNGPTVVITNHAPSFRSSRPEYADSAISGGFCSNLDDLILEHQPDVWIHGHLHDPVDYVLGKTRVLSNPWGYPDENRKREYGHIVVSAKGESGHA